MMDFTKLKELTFDGVKLMNLLINGAQVWKSGPKNWVKYSTEADGVTIYNNGLGYKENTRLNSSAAEVTLNGYAVCGYIPAKAGDIIRAKGLTWDTEHETGCYIWYFDSNFIKQKYSKPRGGTEDLTWTDEGNGVVAFHVENYVSQCAYIRLSAYGSGANAIITVNEEIN